MARGKINAHGAGTHLQRLGAGTGAGDVKLASDGPDDVELGGQAPPRPGKIGQGVGQHPEDRGPDDQVTGWRRCRRLLTHWGRR